MHRELVNLVNTETETFTCDSREPRVVLVIGVLMSFNVYHL